MTSLLIKKATIVCPASPYHLKKRDILVQNGVIEKIAASIDLKGKKPAKVIDRKDVMVSTGWVDLFADFCDPGQEQKEDLESGQVSAMAGGFTTVCLVPNTQPVIAGKSQVEYLKQKSGLVDILPIGAISKNCEGKDLAEMYDMKLSGAVAFSDGKRPVQNAGLLLKALQYVKTFDGIIIQVPENSSIAPNGLMHEGELSTRMGMQGIPSIAETIQIQRDLELLRYTGSRLHFTGISTKKSVELIRQAKKQGIQVTCSVTPYHLLYTDQDLAGYSSNFKVRPPLRSQEDRQALLKGLQDGTIDCIASHHFPQDWDAKETEFEYAANGMNTLQVVLPMLMKVGNGWQAQDWIPLLTDRPRKLLGLGTPEINEGALANLTIFSPTETWTWNKETNQSKSTNSPFYGTELNGRVLGVIHNKQLYTNE